MVRITRDGGRYGASSNPSGRLFKGPVLGQWPGQRCPGFLFHLLDQDEPAQAGKDQAMKVLKEMNELQEFEAELWQLTILGGVLYSGHIGHHAVDGPLPYET